MTMRIGNWRVWAVILTVSMSGMLSYAQRSTPTVDLAAAPGQGSTATGLELISQRPLITGLNGVVTSNQPLASAAGLRILMNGGNAFDAAVATAAATSVVDPAMSTLGGNGFATVYVAATREVKALNFFGTAPLAARPDLFDEEKLNIGVLASPIPSNLKGYQELLEKHGSMKLADVLQPAIELAERGFIVTPEFARSIERSRALFARFPSTARVFLPGGAPPAVGSVFVQADYARTLRQVMTKGADDFYKGDLARRIARFYQDEGGIISLKDLEQYEAKWVKPLWIPYRGYVVYTQPPNSSAIAVLEQLNILKGMDVKALGFHSAPFLHNFMEATRLSLADRNRWVADTDAVPVPVDALLSEEHANRQRNRINQAKAAPVIDPTELVSSPGGNTTHLTVVDRAGNMVALTQTLGDAFGSRVIVGDTGLFFSNQMRHMHLHPESPSKIRGGIRPRSNQSPTIVMKDGVAVMAVGSPGGDAIWQRVAQTLVNLIDFGMNMQDAVAAPRFTYAGPLETGLSIKPVWNVEDRIPAAVVEKLREMGHEVRVVPSEGGAVNGVMRDPRTGALSGGADPRATGWKSYAVGF
jgi:gamma-glutamyltranspeptidase / glutathione hydrolase